MASYIVDASVVIEYLITGPYTPNVQMVFQRNNRCRSISCARILFAGMHKCYLETSSLQWNVESGRKAVIEHFTYVEVASRPDETPIRSCPRNCYKQYTCRLRFRLYCAGDALQLPALHARSTADSGSDSRRGASVANQLLQPLMSVCVPTQKSRRNTEIAS